jgi:hypothetical protein
MSWVSPLLWDICSGGDESDRHRIHHTMRQTRVWNLSCWRTNGGERLTQDQSDWREMSWKLYNCAYDDEAKFAHRQLRLLACPSHTNPIDRFVAARETLCGKWETCKCSETEKDASKCRRTCMNAMRNLDLTRLECDSLYLDLYMSSQITKSWYYICSPQAFAFL